MKDTNLKNEDEYDEIEEKLILEEEKREKQGDMLVSGKSVFDIQRLKAKRSNRSKDK